MKMIRILLFILIIPIILNANVWETGVPLLMIDSYGSRTIALGDTGTGLSGDINLMPINPAGLNTIRSFDISLSYFNHPMETGIYNIYLGKPLPESLYNGFASAGLTFLNIDEFTEFDLLGNETGNQISAGEFMFSLGYANKIFNN